MLLGLDKHLALYIFTSVEDAQENLEAVDIQNDAIEFCDHQGQRYAVTYTRMPREKRFGPLGLVDVGRFKLTAEGSPQAEVPLTFVKLAERIEHSSIASITSVESLRDELRKGT